ncbi:E3 ubiquitin-protein ligase PDZRN3-B [Colossoma macropomum]|uniref:E3 ubiquitin-protein ligase PDZRN3-B n=1 Tax=Colossoma macropomum TaxID=42526 RepID=UPI001864D716|nr:E3 ubiquitin-protein ligase PDZRN3-B [Colossoma macropomum]
MGFELDRFESPVDPDFLCKLCGKVLEEPLTTPCGHVFCAGCVTPWVSERSSCPLRCRRISADELNRVLALKNLVLKLAVKRRDRDGAPKPRHLSDERAPAEERERERGVTGHGREKPEKRSCVEAVRTHGGAPRGEREREARRRAESASARQKRLQLAHLHRELHTTARGKFEELRARSSLNKVRKAVNEGEETRRLTVTLYRASGSLGFNIIGGRSCEGSEVSRDLSDGIYVSKIVENGPADRGGLQIHDMIMKANGRELSLATHDEAVEAFLMARDPVEIEILRRVAPSKASVTPPSGARGVDSSTQTDITLEHIKATASLTSCTTPSCTAVMDKYRYLRTESEVAGYGSLYPSGFFEDTPKDPAREDLEYEEVHLQRVTAQDKLGLTLCYKTDDEEETGIYVSEIDPKSIAAKDGRVREGDRIIQINGVEIQNHEEALAVLSKGNMRNVRLLLARPEVQDDEWLEEDSHGFLDDLHIGVLEQQHCQAMQFTASMLHQRGHEEDGGTTDTATVLSNPHEKDSGVGRTDESTRNDESSEQENLGDDHTSTSDTLPRSGKRCSYSLDVPGSESFLSADGGEFSSIPEIECERFRELLELKCLANENSPLMILGESARSFGNRINLDCEEQEIQMLNEELRNIELECLSIIRSHRLQQEIQRQQPSGDSRDQESCTIKTSAVEGLKRYSITTEVLEQIDSSSAYNTGESCRSSSLALELPSDVDLSKFMQNGGGGAVIHRQRPITEASKLTLSPIQETSPKKSLSTLTEPEATKQGKEKEQGKGHSKSSPPLPPYRQIAHIPAHAQHYQSYMQLIQQKSAVEYGQSEVSLVSLCRTPQSTSADSKPKMEWKVKIRSDGTRYITKRPAREQLLRERALRVREERRGMTTDDDAASELKMGRYWSKEERKQHAVRAKEQRQRRELIKQSRTVSTNEHERRADDIIQLSHRKMMKKRNKKILDSWMTIQELLTHGAKSPDGTRLYNPLLSVTTV